MQSSSKRSAALVALVCSSFIVWSAAPARAQDSGGIVAWGANSYGQCDIPAPNSGFVAVTGGE